METATLVQGVVVGFVVGVVVGRLARFCGMNDDDYWPFGVTWLAVGTGLAAFMVVAYLGFMAETAPR